MIISQPFHLRTRLLADYTVVRDYDGIYKYAYTTPDGITVAGDTNVGKNHVGSKSKKEKKTGLYKKSASKSQSSKKYGDGNLVLDGSAAAMTRGGRIRGRGDIHNNDASLEPFETTLASLSSPGHGSGQRRRTTSTVGTLKNLVILIRFLDHKKRKVPSAGDINILMNSEEVDDVLAPTGSLKMKYWENSYGQLTIESTVIDWIQVERPQAYYADGKSGIDTRRRRFHEALTEALDSLEEIGFNFLDFDADGDGHIDRYVLYAHTYIYIYSG
jgi:hypothetical protein